MTSRIQQFGADRAGFRVALEALLPSCADVGLAEHQFIELEADQPPWVDTGLAVRAGDQITLVLCGRVYFDEANDKGLNSGLQVWVRVGGCGPITRGTRATHTFVAAHDGKVEVGNVNPAEWADRDGAVAVDLSVFGLMTGGTTIALLRWKAGVDPAAGLQAVAARADVDGLLAGEADRLKSAGASPPGWDPLWYLGPTEVFTAAEDGSISCIARDTFAIICHDVDVALTPDTTLTWAWKVDRLPSEVAENTFETHDYLSIAVEFDDGHDLTYQWSAALEPETSYRCPLPHWAERETHLVVRTSTEELGRWLHEERHVHADRAATIGGPDPARIARVWLIAVSFLQRSEGRCAFADIAIADNHIHRQISPASTSPSG